MVSVVGYYNVAVSLKAGESIEASNAYEQPAELSQCKEQLKNEQKPLEDGSSEDDRPKLKFKCKFCKESFKRKDRLDRHVFSHTGEKVFSCDVQGCTKQYTNKFHLKRHKKGAHKTIKDMPSIKCMHPDCNEIFSIQSNMHRHYQTHHANPLPYQCTQCEQKFRRKLQLKKHEIQKHTGQYPYTCPHCKKGCLNTFTYSRHLTTHKADLQVRTCPDCPEKFSKWSLLVDHRRKAHRNLVRFTCDLCEKTFSRKPNIKQHMKLHQFSDTVFQCHYDNCPKFFNAKRNLVSHIRSKHEGKRWVCSFCEIELSTKQKLEQHVLAHLDPKKAAKLPKKKSALSKLIGLDLPQPDELKIIRGEGAQVEANFLPPLESTHETSATELSDF